MAQNELLIKLEKHVNADRFVAAFNESNFYLQVQQFNQIVPSENIYQFEVNTSPHFSQNVLNEFRSRKGVIYVQENHKNVTLRKEPDDPSFVGQWHLRHINAPTAWDLTEGGKNANGEEVVVAVIDVSFERTHFDLEQNFWINLNDTLDSLDNDSNGYVDDHYGWNCYLDSGRIDAISGQGNPSHGTEVAGVIGAVTNNNSGVSSVGWNIKMLPVMASSTDEAMAVKGLNYVLEMRKLYNESDGQKGAFIVACNMSFGVDGGKPSDFPIWCDMIDQLGAQGIITVGAGPNRNWNIDSRGDVPCTCPSDYLVAVTRTDNSDNITGGGYGPVHMDVGAPGIDILTTRINNQVGRNTGTSFAAPQVSAAIALMHSVLPQSILDQYSNDPSGLAKLLRYYLLNNSTRTIDGLSEKISTGGVLDLGMAVEIAQEGPQLSVSSEEEVTDRFKVFPNPAKNFLNISKKQSSYMVYHIRLMDLSGKEVISTTEDSPVSLNTGNLSPGVYVLHLEGGGVREYHKIVITDE